MLKIWRINAGALRTSSGASSLKELIKSTTCIRMKRCRASKVLPRFLCCQTSPQLFPPHLKSFSAKPSSDASLDHIMVITYSYLIDIHFNIALIFPGNRDIMINRNNIFQYTPAPYEVNQIIFSRENIRHPSSYHLRPVYCDFKLQHKYTMAWCNGAVVVGVLPNLYISSSLQVFHL